MVTLNGYAEQFAKLGGGKANAPILTTVGVPVTLLCKVGKPIGTRQKVAQIEKPHDKGQLDDIEYYKPLQELQKTQTLDAVGTGLVAGVAVAYAFVVKAGLVLTEASASVVGGAVLAAIAIGARVKFVLSYSTGSKTDSGDME